MTSWAGPSSSSAKGCGVSRPRALTDGDVPDALRRLIEQQALRLGPEDQRLLEVASVVGVEFSAAAVAAPLGEDQAVVEERCARLVRLGRFLVSRGGIDWPDGTTAAAYGFVHAFHHEVIYESLPAGHRRQLHEQIAGRLERAFAGRPREAAAELAMHFERARDARRAVRYHRLAGEVALGRAANAEAIAQLSSGLDALEAVPQGVERSRLELGLRFALGPAWIVSRGYAAPEVERTYARALELARRLRDARAVTRALRGLWNVHLIRADLARARKLATELLTRARASRDGGALGVAHAALAETLFHAGDLAAARVKLGRALAAFGPRVPSVRTSQRPRVAAYAAWAMWLAGYPDQARRLCWEGIAEARALARPHSHAFAVGYASFVYLNCGDVSRVAELVEELVAVCRDHDIPWWQSVADAQEGWVLARRGQGKEGTLRIRRAIAAHHEMGSRLGATNFLTVLAEIYRETGKTDAGLQAVEEALALAASTGDRVCEPDMHRVRGELLLQRDAGGGIGERARIDAERCLRRAIGLARRRSARGQELRAASRLARLWQSRGERERARRLLAPLCRWFTEGADTPDVRAARQVLEELATPQRARALPRPHRASGQADHVEHAPAVLARQKPVRARHGVVQRLHALAHRAPRPERREVHAGAAERLAGRSGPLVGRLDHHERVAEHLVARRRGGDQLERVGLRERIGSRHHEVMADLARRVRLPELRIRDGQRLQRLRVLCAEQREDRLHELEDGIEEGVAEAKGRRPGERWHRLVQRAADHLPGVVEDRE